MYYQIMTIATRPGVRLRGIEHLKKLAVWAEQKYNFKSQVVGNVGGAVYQNYLVSSFDSLDNAQKITRAMVSDPEYGEWFEESMELFEWSGITIRQYEVL